MVAVNLRHILVAIMFACSGMLFFFPVEPTMNTDVLFDDPVKERIENERVEVDHSSELILLFRHDDGKELTNNLSRVQSLIQLEIEVMDGSNSNTSFDSEDVRLNRIETPLMRWSDAFASRNRSLENASRWVDVLQPTIEDGWCGENATDEEKTAFEASMLMLPQDSNYGVACPSFSGASVNQPPAANELLWLIWLESDNKETDWGELSIWADKISEETEFEVTPVGMNMLFQKSKEMAENDFQVILPMTLILLSLILFFWMRDFLLTAVTLGGVALVICSEIGFLSLIGFDFSILDGIAIPIIMGVAVDGAFWYCKSSRNKEEVRSMLFIAMVTTIAAVSLAIFSPIRANRSIALVMAIGIFLDWLVTRFLLEEFYLSRRSSNNPISTKSLKIHPSLSWCWPVSLLMLASIAVIAPGGVEVFDIQQLLPEDDPGYKEMEELQSKYMLATSTTAWIVVDVEGDSTEDLQQVRDLQQQLGRHPSVISFDTGLIKTPMIMGIPDGGGAETTIDQVSEMSPGTIMLDDARLQRNGVTTGISIAVLIDVQNTDAGLIFADDVAELLNQMGIQGDIGGDLPTGGGLARTFEENRVSQILFAGLAIFVASVFVTRTPSRAARIAIGTIAIGLAVDGLANLFGGRSINTAPTVLLGMGFAADYLSHASAEHLPTKNDTAARWGAGITSISIFFLLGFATWPLAKNSGKLLSISVLISIILATFLSMTHVLKIEHGEEE
jgi:predicted RND superfamily exporter protein